MIIVLSKIQIDFCLHYSSDYFIINDHHWSIQCFFALYSACSIIWLMLNYVMHVLCTFDLSCISRFMMVILRKKPVPSNTLLILLNIWYALNDIICDFKWLNLVLITNYMIRHFVNHSEWLICKSKIFLICHIIQGIPKKCALFSFGTGSK